MSHHVLVCVAFVVTLGREDAIFVVVQRSPGRSCCCLCCYLPCGVGPEEEWAARPVVCVSLSSCCVLTPEKTASGMDFPCSQQQEGAMGSMACQWSLAEAQQKLNSLALHNSESIDQENATSQTELSELQRREEEWRQKEAALPLGENWVMSSSDAFSQDVFNKSFINQAKTMEVEDQSVSFLERYEDKIRHFGMLRRWNDSQCFLSENPDLVCEETARYLALWCYHLESEQKTALMEQVAHQAVVMQFIIEIAKSSNVDPRGCFRLFFQKAKADEEGYIEAFKSGLEAFKLGVRMHSQSQRHGALNLQNPSHPAGFEQMNTQNTPHCHLHSDVLHWAPIQETEGEDTKTMDIQ